MKRFRFFPIHLSVEFKPCVHCGQKTTWRCEPDNHPCCPDCLESKRLELPDQPTPYR